MHRFLLKERDKKKVQKCTLNSVITPVLNNKEHLVTEGKTNPGTRDGDEEDEESERWSSRFFRVIYGGVALDPKIALSFRPPPKFRFNQNRCVDDTLEPWGMHFLPEVSSAFGR